MPTCPAHWRVVRPKTIFRRMQRSVRPEDGVVTAFRDGVVTLRKNRRTTGFTEALQEIGYQGIRKGDLVIHAMDAFAGAIGVSDSDGKGTPVYSVCQPTGDANSWYYALVLREMSRSGYLLSLAKGIRERSTDFRFVDFASLMVPLPPVEEQEQIVRFVRQLDSRVNRLIKAKRRLIELLNEQKQAIIHQAVTRGLDPTVPLKPSGINWLGNIPQHWRAIAIKRMLKRMDYGTSESSMDEGAIRVLTMGHIRDGEINVPVSGGLDAVPDFLLLEQNDLLFNRTNSPDLVGKVGIFKGTVDDRVTFASYLVRLRVLDEHSPFWLNYLLGSREFWGFARSQALVSLHQANLNSTRYGQMLVPVPPPNEQVEIAEHLRGALATFELGMAKARSEIDFIREYRSRLVADVVTGQLDVRQHPWANIEIEDSTEPILDDTELEDDLEETDDVLEEAGV